MATTSYTIYSHYDPAQRERLERETGQIPSDPPAIDSAEAWEAEATLAFKRKLAPPPRFVPAARDPPKTEERPRRTSSSPESAAGSFAQSCSRSLEKRSKNNWFIMNAITSEPAQAAALPAAPPPTLADILARDPPPLPNEAQYAPPVWLAIGPANKGFEMLQNSGWMKRDGLIKEEDLDRPIIKEEQEIIDLTMSDSESSEEESEVDEDNMPAATKVHTEGSRKALITPIATVLKSDRLGIGLKAKTVGPYRASQKRITHNAAAMLAHVKAAEEMRKQKKQGGRGHRGFASRRKVEEANRKALLAYMNQG
ncbi:hypothetical protein DFH09DRAFT_1247914 [Mycena vulgaris]|nr:hypothetical protein DFH09DRAFT_1247914 [Mycena vulgaris]